MRLLDLVFDGFLHHDRLLVHLPVSFVEAGEENLIEGGVCCADDDLNGGDEEITNQLPSQESSASLESTFTAINAWGGLSTRAAAFRAAAFFSASIATLFLSSCVQEQAVVTGAGSLCSAASCPSRPTKASQHATA